MKKDDLTIGEFASLAGINKRTLHYYDEIGLFSPYKTTSSGYRLYSPLQIVDLETILTLRRLDFSIEEISALRSKEGGEEFETMLKKKSAAIAKALASLRDIQAFLDLQQRHLEEALKAKKGEVTAVKLKKTKLLLSEKITGAYDEEDFAVASDFALRLKKLFGLYGNFGSRISVDALYSGAFHSYDRFFYFAPKTAKACDETLEEAAYLKTHSFGPWSNLESCYRHLLSYAEERGLELYGHAYEFGLNELSLAHQDDYITLVLVPFREKKTGDPFPARKPTGKLG